MPKSTFSKEVQKQVCREGVIVGTVSSVRAMIEKILEDTRIRKIVARYSPNPKPKPGKKPGGIYVVMAGGMPPGKGIQSAEEVAQRIVQNDLLMIYAMDTGRRSHRTLKIPLIESVEVYTGRRVLDKETGEDKAERVAIPVHVVH